MIREALESHDRVVKCLFCAQPFPISARLASLYVVAKDEAEREEQARRSQVVTLRCPKCSREAPYRRSDVITREVIAGELPGAEAQPKAFKRAAS